MGTTQDNVKATDAKSKNFLDGIKKLARGAAPKEIPPAGLPLIELLGTIDGKLNEIISVKRQDVTKENDRYSYNAKALVHLEVAQDMFQYVIENFHAIQGVSPNEDFLADSKGRSGFDKLLRPKTSKQTAQTLVDLMANLDERVEGAIKARQAPSKNPDRLKVLTYLELVRTFLHQTVRQLTEVSDLSK